MACFCAVLGLFKGMSKALKGPFKGLSTGFSRLFKGLVQELFKGFKAFFFKALKVVFGRLSEAFPKAPYMVCFYALVQAFFYSRRSFFVAGLSLFFFFSPKALTWLAFALF